jgi:hypothetical protein
MNNSIEKNSFEKPDKKRMRVNQQVFHNLLEITELYPQYSLCQHFAAILRRKDVKAKEFFHWKDEELLKHIEQHKQELEGDDLMNIGDEEETFS